MQLIINDAFGPNKTFKYEKLELLKEQNLFLFDRSLIIDCAIHSRYFCKESMILLAEWMDDVRDTNFMDKPQNHSTKKCIGPVTRCCSMM